MLQSRLTICLFIHGLLFECVSNYTMGSKTEHPRHLGNQLIIPGAARISQRWDLRSYDMLRGDDTLLQTLRDKLSVPPTT